MPNPRPHLGEPLALDLLNTRWISTEGRQDLLTDVPGVRQWLADNDLDLPADEPTRQALITAREAILRAVKGDTADDLNAVLAHGRVRRALTPTGPASLPEVADPAHLPGWLAADNLLHLLAGTPERIKQCAHPNCVLFFLDTSKNGTRRWHSMAACGNRAKATRHYAKKTHSD
ncbi:CGNR zinc finger domain-containing protein [Nocardia sp. CDC153]|uniref:CGNR zinc finger domain-containing protein n=1 Tax=Nocardia sp. CDC153 TaxID=3112167 RepID=UPI002DB8E37C|nr:CGNR zinc finger domain-containing protein [Nocardia sp. CDC153]MEC3954151.1 CGNR zinc finger domain-containing protein [Nocardia sp. CDC153]